MTTTVNRDREAQQLAAQARLRRLISRTITYAGMTFLGFLFLFPIIFMIVAAFKPNERVISDLASIQAFLPDLSTLTLDNIQDVFNRVAFEQYVFNSLLITLITVIAGLFVNSMAAFVLARLRWPLRRTILALIVSLIIIPLEAIAVPLLMEVNEMTLLMNGIVMAILLLLLVLIWGVFWNSINKFLEDRRILYDSDGPRQALAVMLTLLLALPFELLVFMMTQQIAQGGTWLNTYHVQILPFIAEPFSIFLFYQFFIGIPKDFDEAAYVDGAGPFRIYWQIVVPISRPVFATVAILKFLQFWSFYLWPLMVTRSDEYRPLMVGMDFFQTQEPILWGSIMAYAAMVTIPVLIVFLLFQKWFVQSVSSSGVKG